MQLLLLNSILLLANNTTSCIKDSLLTTINQEHNIEVKITKYIKFIQFLNNSDPGLAINYCDTAIELCRQHHLKRQETLVLLEKIRSSLFNGEYNVGSDLIFLAEQEILKSNDPYLKGLLYSTKNLAYIYTADYPAAMENGLKAIILLKEANDTFNLAKMYNNIGVIYDNTSDNRKALDFYLIGQEYALAINNQELMSTIDINIGVIYDKLGDKEKALRYYYKSLAYAELNGDLKAKATTYNNIASLLADIKRYDEALAANNKALEIYNYSQNLIDRAYVYSNIGNLYLKLNKFDSAKYYLNQSLTIFSEFGDKSNIAETHYSMGKLNFSSGNYEMAIRQFNKSIEYSGSLGMMELHEKGLLKLSEVFAALKNFEKAYKSQLLATAVGDSLRKFNSVSEIKYSDLQIKFRNQASEFEKELKNIEENRLSEIRKQRVVRALFILTILFFISLAVFIFRSFIRSSKSNENLVKKNREIEGQKELIEISNLELREQYTFTETLLNTIPNPVYYTDRAGQILGCNRAFEEITGKTINNMMGLMVSKLNIGNNFHGDTTKIADNPENELLRTEETMVFVDGFDHDVICYRRGIVDNNLKLLGILGIIIDITDIREVEKQLKYSQSRLKEAINAKDKFFNIMAHDLKNPFNAILGLTSIIDGNFDKYTEAQLKEFISLINESANNIYSLLENILEWARAQSGSIEINPIPFFVNEVIQDAINIFNHSISQRKIVVALNLAKDFEVVSDKNMMMTIFRNLLSNAIKFTKQAGRIEIISVNEEDYIRISIKDSGLGISPKNLEKLFRIDQPISTLGVENEKGTGLGLIICQEFIKQNGGTITVESVLGEGSTFHVRIPVS